MPLGHIITLMYASVGNIPPRGVGNIPPRGVGNVCVSIREQLRCMVIMKINIKCRKQEYNCRSCSIQCHFNFAMFTV